MVATRSFRISPPTKKDLDVAEAAWRDGTLVHDVSVNTKCWRVLRAAPSADPREHAELCYPSVIDSRFTPIYQGGHIVAAAYAGSTPEIALWEVILRDIRHKGIKRVRSMKRATDT